LPYYIFAAKIIKHIQQQKNGACASRFINLNQDYLGPKSKGTATQRITIIRAPNSNTSGPYNNNNNNNNNNKK